MSGPDGARVDVMAAVENPERAAARAEGFVEAGGYVSIEADNYSRAVDAGGCRWRRIDRIGRTGAA